MSISNGQAANETNFNNAFHSRTASQTVVNKDIDGTNATGTNDVKTDADKVTIESTGNYYSPGDTDTAVQNVDTQVKSNADDIASNESDITTLQGQFNTTTGHDHDGTDSKKVLGTDINQGSATVYQVLAVNGSGNLAWQDQIVGTSEAYIGTPNGDGTWPDNSWRINISGGKLTFQKRVSSTWTTYFDMGE